MESIKVPPEVTPAIFQQRQPCADCPFRREGGVRHSPDMMASYIGYFMRWPGSTFPCHKSVPKDIPRDRWTPWQPGQVVCAGGLILAAKRGWLNAVMAYARLKGWWQPLQYNEEAFNAVFDDESEMLAASVDEERKW